MAASNQISPSGSYNHAGFDYFSPKTTAPTTDITVLSAPSGGSNLAVFDVTNLAIQVDQIDELTATAGVTIDSVLCKDGGVELSSTVKFTGSRGGIIMDAATKEVCICGGTQITSQQDYGAYGRFFANSHGSAPGALELQTGDVSGANCNIGTTNDGIFQILTVDTVRLAVDDSGYLQLKGGYPSLTGAIACSTTNSDSSIPIKNASGTIRYIPLYNSV